MKINKHIKNTLIPHRRNGYKPHAIKHQGLLVVAALLLLLQGTFNSSVSGTFEVLGYATNVDIGSLLSLTNQQRSASGLSALSLNGKLNAAAQGKAQHMISNNYWAHTSPSGITPWYWIDNTGYAYSKAGENLAYGFATSSDTITGWMNSPGHRANILDGSFKEVGFGVANGANFQGGENTVVVAMYAQPIVSQPQTAAAPRPAATATPTSSPASNPPPASQEQPKKEKTKKDEPAPTKEEQPAEEQENASLVALLARDDNLEVFGAAPVQDNLSEVKGTTFTNLQALVTGQAHWTFYASFALLASLAGIYVIRHATVVYQLVKHGEHYVVGHPLLEASLLYASIWLLLAGSYGAVL